MNTIKIYENEEFGAIRVVEKDGEPWFVVSDVCTYFGVTNRNRVMQSIAEEDKGGTQMDTPGGKQVISIVNESGLYSLLFALQPQKARGVNQQEIDARCDKLKKFKRWVTSEVLPSIRKHGAYMTPETLRAALLNPDTVIQLCQALKDEQDRNRQLQTINSALTVDKAIMQPKADYFDELVDRNLLTNFRETAKQLGIKQRQFVDWLIEHKYVYRDKKGKLMPYAGKGDDLFEVKECFNEKTEWSGTQTLITPKGRETFRLLLEVKTA